MTASPERQMELTLPMVPDIEIAAARAAAISISGTIGSVSSICRSAGVIV